MATRGRMKKKLRQPNAQAGINCMCVQLESCAPIWLINFLKMTSSIVLNEKQRVFRSSVRPAHTATSLTLAIIHYAIWFNQYQSRTNRTSTHTQMWNSFMPLQSFYLIPMWNNYQKSYAVAKWNQKRFCCNDQLH